MHRNAIKGLGTKRKRIIQFEYISQPVKFLIFLQYKSIPILTDVIKISKIATFQASY